ncbi:MAG: carbohydrate ABC transporter permease [Marmoricola sp.]
MIVLLLTTTLPLAFLIWTSLRRYNLTSPAGNGFVGLGNYEQIAHDSEFWDSLLRSVIYTVATVGLQVAIGLGLALLVERIAVGRAIVRVAAIMPIMFAPVVVGLVWRTLLLTPQYGVVDFAAQKLGIGSHNWLGEPTLAFASVIVMHTWQWTPFAFLIFLAALATFPTELDEAAKLDGASAGQRFRYILLPHLRPSIVVVVIFRTVVALSAFDAIFAATGGGPGTATQILNLYIYRVTFQDFSIGYGSALAVVLLFITAVVAFFFSRIRAAR